MKHQDATVGIVGGGVGGAVIAIVLDELGIDSVLFEEHESLVNGPPFCHLHAGGNLYPDISDKQCRKLMEQSIDMARLFPRAIDKRPTFISIPKTEKYEPKKLRARLDMLTEHYKKLIDNDAKNAILGTPENYYKTYNRADLDALKKHPMVAEPTTEDEWMTTVARVVNYEKLKMPVFLVNEYGWNLFRVAAHTQIALEASTHSTLRVNEKVNDVIDCRDSDKTYNWQVKTNVGDYRFQYLINAGGFRTGNIDNLLHIERKCMVEFKAAYVAAWNSGKQQFPEMIFHGERGTTHGMAQLTPYHGGFYQIHGMTQDITLFRDGLVHSCAHDAQPHLKTSFENRIFKGWQQCDIDKRTRNAIAYVSNFVPLFSDATVAAPPLFGAQQIPGDDPSLRVAEVCFPEKFYARSEIVKASSALDTAFSIIENMKKMQIIANKPTPKPRFDDLHAVQTKAIDTLAAKLATERGFPKAMSKLLVP